jgi:para-aminobenzoate synthetase/4-amino-4-deoxychorismate lyase
VFETIRVAGGRPRWLHDHCARLEGSCRALGLPVPDHLPSRVSEAAAALADGGVRVLVNAAGVQISVRALPPAGATTLRPMVVPGGLGAHKWADRGLIDVYSHPGVAPLICDLDGDVLEAGYAAVLLATDDALIAPPLDGRLLASVSRHHTLEAGRRAGRRVVIRPITIDQLRAADAIILTSSLRGPHPGMLAGESTILVAPAICGELARQLATD